MLLIRLRSPRIGRERRNYPIFRPTNMSGEAEILIEAWNRAARFPPVVRIEVDCRGGRPFVEKICSGHPYCSPLDCVQVGSTPLRDSMTAPANIGEVLKPNKLVSICAEWDELLPMPIPEGLFRKKPINRFVLASNVNVSSRSQGLVDKFSIPCGPGVQCGWKAGMDKLSTSYALANLAFSPELFSGEQRFDTSRSAEGVAEMVLEKPEKMGRRSLVVEKFRLRFCGKPGAGIPVFELDTDNPRENPVGGLIFPEQGYSYLFRARAWPGPGVNAKVWASEYKYNCVEAKLADNLFRDTAANSAWVRSIWNKLH